MIKWLVVFALAALSEARLAYGQDCSAVRAQMAAGSKKLARPPYDCTVCAEKARELKSQVAAAEAPGAQASGWSSSSAADRQRWEAARNNARCAVQAMDQEVAACNAGQVGPFRVCAPNGGGGPAGASNGGASAGADAGDDPFADIAKQAAAQQKAAIDELTKLGHGADGTSYGGSGAGHGKNVAKNIGSASLEDLDGNVQAASFFLGDLKPIKGKSFDDLADSERRRERGFVEQLGQGLLGILGAWGKLQGGVKVQLTWPPPSAPPKKKKKVCLPGKDGKLPPGCFSDVHLTNPH
jgi:hypothetical protein